MEQENECSWQEYVKNEIEKESERGWIYFVAGGGYVKIGKTAKMPTRRVAQFSPKLPFETEILFAFQVADYHFVEQGIHKHLERYRVRGEWFEIPDDGFEEIMFYFKDEILEYLRGANK